MDRQRITFSTADSTQRGRRNERGIASSRALLHRGPRIPMSVPEALGCCYPEGYPLGPHAVFSDIRNGCGSRAQHGPNLRSMHASTRRDRRCTGVIGLIVRSVGIVNRSKHRDGWKAEACGRSKASKLIPYSVARDHSLTKEAASSLRPLKSFRRTVYMPRSNSEMES